MSRARLLSLPLLLLSCAACASSSFPPIDFTKLPKLDAYPNAAWVVLSREWTLHFHEVDGKPVADITEYERTRVMNDEGRSMGNLVTYYNRELTQLLDARCRVTQPDGTAKEFARAQMKDAIAIESFALYEDSRIVFHDNTAPPGSVIDCRTTRRYVDPRLPSFGFPFGARVPLLHARFEVIAPADWEVDHAAARYWQSETWAPASSKTETGETRLVWEKEMIYGFPYEPSGPADVDRIPRVFARLASWVINGKKETAFKDHDEHARWLSTLHKDTAKPTPEIERQVQAVLRGAPDDPREKARRLYEWVQSNIRYVAVEIGLGGLRPHTAKEVFDTKYGDCKDKATLLKSMLEVAGIKSDLAVLYAHEGYPHRWMQPTPSYGNHAILSIELPGGAVIADPTTRAVPFGELPPGDQEAELVLVRDSGNVLVKTPASTAEQNQTHVRLELQVGAGGDARGKFHLDTRGAYASELRREVLIGNEQEKKNVVEGPLRLKDMKTTAIRFDERAGEGASAFSISAEGELTAQHMIAGGGGVRVFRLSDAFHTPGRALPAGDRHSAVVIPVRERRSLELELGLPGGATVSTVPGPVKLSSEFGSYELSFTASGAKLRVESKYELDERIIPEEKYGALKQFFDGIIAAEATAIVVREEGKK